MEKLQSVCAYTVLPYSKLYVDAAARSQPGDPTFKSYEAAWEDATVSPPFSFFHPAPLYILLHNTLKK